MSSDPAMVAWAAGLFEGEGSIHLSRSKRKRRDQLSLRVTMTDEDVVRRFAAAVGCGTVVGPIAQHSRIAKMSKPLWQWRVGSRRDVFEVMGALLPWLGERRAMRWQEVFAEVTSRDLAYSYSTPRMADAMAKRSESRVAS